jgi:type II secretory pathway component GspD/PulD (secretin)
MKKKLTSLLLGLATSGLVSFAQDNIPPAEPKPADNNQPAQTVPVTSDPVPVPGDPATTPAEKEARIRAAEEARQKAIGEANKARKEGENAPVADPATPAVSPDTLVVAARETADDKATNAVSKGDEAVPLIVIDDVPLTDAIRNLARQSNLNFQFDPRVTASNQPNVSIRFENVSAQEALNAVLENYGLALIKEPKSKIARVTIKDPKAEDPLISRIVQLKYSDPSNLVGIVKTTLSPRSTVVADARTSQLIISTTEKELDAVLPLIDKLDTSTKQVLIEAKLLETSKNPTTIKGIDWSGTLEKQKFSFGNNLQDKPVVDLLSVNKPLASAVNIPKVLVDTAKGFNPATAFLDADGVSAVLSFLNKDSETEVVATPRAVTLDNQMAILSVTKAVPIFQITPGSANSPAGATINYTNLGVILYVTPRIAADNNISLKVVPEVSNIDSKDEQFLNGSLNTANIYAIRRIDTSVMIPSGNTLVMGGLVNDAKTKSYVKVPVLGDIPLVGAAFRRESKTRNKQNLIIFITPTVVDDGDFLASTTGRAFLQTRAVESPEEKESALDSARPYDWSKPRH